MDYEKRYESTIERGAAEGYDATGTLSGRSPDRVNDDMEKGVYAPAIAKGRIPALFAHDHEKIIGVWENLREVGDTLVGDLRLAKTRLGEYVKALIEANVPLSNSIGFRGKGKANSKGGVTFSSIDIYEASVCAVGAHPQALMIAKSFGVSLDDQPVVTERDAIQRKADAALQSSLNVLRK